MAGAELSTAGVLGLAMLAYQASIGSLNDVVDAERDRIVRPEAPIPAGLVSRRTAAGIAIVGGTLGTLVSASFGAAVLAVGSAGYTCGLAYDLFMRRLGWGWLCFSAAFPLLLAWTWLAAAGSLPPGWPALLPLAALAGPALHLANSLVDLEDDLATGRQSLAASLGRERARIILALLVAAICSLGWAALLALASPSRVATLAAACATMLAGGGVALSWRASTRDREMGWLIQAVGLALLVVAWAGSLAKT